MEKLELSHIAPYLPYGLKCQIDLGQDEIVVTDSWGLKTGSDYPVSYYDEGKRYGLMMSQIKPLLRPLSDLYKEIDGKVGIVELAKMLGDFKELLKTNKMRQIKFRGKLLHSNEWIEGNLIIANNGHSYIIPFDVFEPDGHHLRIDSDTPFWVDPDTVSQFTGLVDRNGKEIYEGDVMGRLFDDYNENTIILYHKGILCAKPISKDKFRPLNAFNDCGWVRVDEGYNYNFQVIGNIHGNPELLNEKQ